MISRLRRKFYIRHNLFVRRKCNFFFVKQLSSCAGNNFPITGAFVINGFKTKKMTKALMALSRESKFLENKKRKNNNNDNNYNERR